MEDVQRKIITSKLDDLVRNTECKDNFLNIFVSADIFDEEDVEHIKAEDRKTGKFAATSKFYSILVTRSGAYQCLYNALLKTNQKGAIELVRKGEVEAGVAWNTADLKQEPNPQ